MFMEKVGELAGQAYIELKFFSRHSIQIDLKLRVDIQWVWSLWRRVQFRNPG